MRKLYIATGASRTAVLWKNTAITWEELKERLQTTCRTTETPYQSLTKEVLANAEKQLKRVAERGR